MTPTRPLVCFGAKGGQGTTLVATLAGLISAEHRPVTLRADPTEVAAILGLVHDGQGEVRLGNLTVTDDPNAEPDIIDLGAADDPLGWHDGRLIMVLRGPGYLELRAALGHPIRPEGVVLVAEEGRALGPDDVTAVLGVPLVTRLAWDPALARAIDAGLLPARITRLVRRAISPLAAAQPTPRREG